MPETTSRPRVRWRLTRRGELAATVVCTLLGFALVCVLAQMLGGAR